MRILLTPSTELEAVNYLLFSIGETPVNTLDEDATEPIALVAHRTLHQISRQVQAMGLHCNSETDYLLRRDVNGYLWVPVNTLKADASDPTVDVVLRGQRLYDRANHTYRFDRDLRVDLVLFLPFEELPQVVRDYITVRAVRVFQSKVLGSEALHSFSVQDEAEARLAMIQEEVDSGDYNILRNPDVTRMLRRR